MLGVWSPLRARLREFKPPEKPVRDVQIIGGDGAPPSNKSVQLVAAARQSLQIGFSHHRLRHLAVPPGGTTKRLRWPAQASRICCAQ
jgi:hypothetical protein